MHIPFIPKDIWEYTAISVILQRACINCRPALSEALYLLEEQCEVAVHDKEKDSGTEQNTVRTRKLMKCWKVQ